MRCRGRKTEVGALFPLSTQSEHSSSLLEQVEATWRPGPPNRDLAANAETQAEVVAGWGAHAPIESRFDDLECARLAVLKRLLRTPAPDLPALALKIELAVDQEAATLDGGERCLAALKADG